MEISNGLFSFNGNDLNFGESLEKIAETLGESARSVNRWEETIISQEFVFLGYVFYGRLLFNETGFYCLMFEPVNRKNTGGREGHESFLKLFNDFCDSPGFKEKYRFEVVERGRNDFCLILQRKLPDFK